MLNIYVNKPYTFILSCRRRAIFTNLLWGLINILNFTYTLPYEGSTVGVEISL